MKQLLIWLYIAVSSLTAQAQQKLILLNGKEIRIKSYSLNDQWLVYKKFNDLKEKTRLIDKYDVFSVIKEDSTEEIIYQGDSTVSVENARNFIRGEHAAMKFYRKNAHVGESAIIGMASSVLVFYSLPLPMFNSVILGRFTPKMDQLPEGYDLPYSLTEEYRYGYEKKARNIKIQQSLKWGYIGLGVGLTGFIIYGLSK